MRRMTRALGPHDVLVNVRAPGAYEHWHGRDGLRCMNCYASVHVMQRPNGSRWIRHSAADRQRCAAAADSGPEGYEHQLLKYWLRDWLRSRGFKAECEEHVGSSVPDVFAKAPDGQRRLAVEVQLVHLSESDAQHRTGLLLAEHVEVLWITHHCNWVVQLPAIGLNVQTIPDGPATEIDGLYYSVREGILTCGPNGQLQGGRETALETFMDRYLKQEAHWALLRPTQYGFALDTDWEQHLEWQGGRIEELEENLQRVQDIYRERVADHERQLAEIRTDHQHQLGEIREQLARQESQDQMRIRMMEDQIGALHRARDTAESAGLHHREANKQLQDALNSTWWGARFLKRHSKP